MISSNFKVHLESVLGCNITNAEPVSGGDISKALCIHTSTERFFCKINQSSVALKMFQTEKLGLDEINQTNTIKSPKVLSYGQHEAISYLLMEFIETRNPTSKEMEGFGHQLGKLHSYPIGDFFGWKQDNFIGSLPQTNKNHSDWSLFYIHERLLPQLNLAREKGFLNSSEIPSKERLLKVCKQLMPEVIPALLHGDLWSGNYLISTLGIPYLIDPAVYFGHHEVDIAMTRLFGGFSSQFYQAYNEYIPKESCHEERNDIYQLYYLLVHLNLFGKSYYASVKQLLKTYFD